jgi:hypothetical protein
MDCAVNSTKQTVGTSLDMLWESLANLDQQCNTLESRLSSVLRSESPVPVDPRKNSDTSSNVMSRIEISRTRVDDTIAGLVSIMERLEL